MGFFSAVKKFFGHKPQAEPSADAPPPEPDLNAVDTGTPEKSPEKSPEESQPVSNEPAATDTLATQANQELLTALRAAPPRLSAWLEVVLADQDEVGPEFWRRLNLFLEALEAPRDEINAFLSGFRSWLETMEYTHVEDFRSELQYRLALALELEDEEDERNRLMLKLSEGLKATREQLGRR
ncbi:MAG: signal recognition particle-docking protein FtsY, partial [Desulfovibrio sp.]|nr:signal recognition particle-docking protein FtsY [Desulfovibrio sp.]